MGRRHNAPKHADKTVSPYLSKKFSRFEVLAEISVIKSTKSKVSNAELPKAITRTRTDNVQIKRMLAVISLTFTNQRGARILHHSTVSLKQNHSTCYDQRRRVTADYLLDHMQ